MERTDLKIPRRRVVAELCLAGQPARRVELFLSEHSRPGWQRQDIIDLVEGERRFLPCRDTALGTATLINRDHIVWLAVPMRDERRADDDNDNPEFGPLYDRRTQVTLHLSGGIALEGAILYSAPVEHARLGDHVNEPGTFLALHWSDQILLVRKSAVIEIVETGAPGAGDRVEETR